MTSVQARAVTVVRGDETVLRDLDLFVPSGSSLAVLGMSGSGKTTLLRALAGLETAAVGNIYVGGTDVTNVGAGQRGVTWVRDAESLVDGRMAAPPVVLLDEPVVDATAFRSATVSSTVIIATNEWSVASALCDRVAVLYQGAFVQVATPTEMYEQPIIPHVAELTAEFPLNQLRATIRPRAGEQTRVITSAGIITTWRPIPAGDALVGIRAENLIVDVDGPLRATVRHAAPMGPTYLARLDADGHTLHAIGQMPPPPVGEEVRLRPRMWHLF